ncbi:putative phage abortive infection protein [Larkinella arboricola]|uniref:Putative phage abortive infection protein n=2 Tax=Larkinella arboricola TaxID=643671 RepID=A0A327WGH8_LARAB|nr:putative phage abortive infection protein [Larkinella arboricola]
MFTYPQVAQFTSARVDQHQSAQMAQFGVAYSRSSRSILRTRFLKVYNAHITNEVISELKLKPKRESFLYELWNISYNKSLDLSKSLTSLRKYKERNINITDSDLILLNKTIDELTFNGFFSSDEERIKSYTDLIKKDVKYNKYYGGHQHRLGHYYRHLFQSFKYIKQVDILNSEERYFYAKTLRAQLSTFEQSLLFVNSISSLGRKWELEPDSTEKDKDGKQLKLISDFHLIKNLSGEDINGIRYDLIYPDVKYESKD